MSQDGEEQHQIVFESVATINPRFHFGKLRAAKGMRRMRIAWRHHPSQWVRTSTPVQAGLGEEKRGQSH